MTVMIIAGCLRQTRICDTSSGMMNISEQEYTGGILWLRWWIFALHNNWVFPNKSRDYFCSRNILSRVSFCIGMPHKSKRNHSTVNIYSGKGPPKFSGMSYEFSFPRVLSPSPPPPPDMKICTRGGHLTIMAIYQALWGTTSFMSAQHSAVTSYIMGDCHYWPDNDISKLENVTNMRNGPIRWNTKTSTIQRIDFTTTSKNKMELVRAHHHYKSQRYIPLPRRYTT
jgi:hypothetical protein